MIVIADYQAGNLASVLAAFLAAGADARIARDAEAAEGAAGIVVPGVGHFAATERLGGEWRDAIRRHVDVGRPLLGICLGMQWLFEASEEAPGRRGLGVFRGTCARLPARDPRTEERVKVPHVGWNAVEETHPSRALAGVAGQPRPYFYFTHSYAAPECEECVAVTEHGSRFPAVVERGRVWGMQFHPEKSGEAGLQVLRNFVRLVQV